MLLYTWLLKKALKTALADFPSCTAHLSGSSETETKSTRLQAGLIVGEGGRERPLIPARKRWHTLDPTQHKGTVVARPYQKPLSCAFRRDKVWDYGCLELWACPHASGRGTTTTHLHHPKTLNCQSAHTSQIPLMAWALLRPCRPSASKQAHTYTSIQQFGVTEF